MSCHIPDLALLSVAVAHHLYPARPSAARCCARAQYDPDCPSATFSGSSAPRLCSIIGAASDPSHVSDISAAALWRWLRGLAIVLLCRTGLCCARQRQRHRWHRRTDTCHAARPICTRSRAASDAHEGLLSAGRPPQPRRPLRHRGWRGWAATPHLPARTSHLASIDRPVRQQLQ